MVFLFTCLILIFLFGFVFVTHALLDWLIETFDNGFIVFGGMTLYMVCVPQGLYSLVQGLK